MKSMPKVCRRENSFKSTSLYKEEKKEKERKGESKRKGKRNLPCGSKQKQSMGEQLKKNLKNKGGDKVLPLFIIIIFLPCKF